MAQNNQHNFNNGFRQSTNLIPPQDWTNSGNLMHNNIAPNVYNELVMDYYLHIDSYDRDVNAYPSSFKFTVSLGGSGTSSEKVYDKQTGTFQTINYTGVPEPRIQRNFYNVKYISLDKIILPKFAVYSFTLNEDVPPVRTYTGVTSFSEKYRYLILKIKELDNNRIFSTNNRVSDDSFVIYKDKDLGGSNSEIWLSSYCKRTYLKSSLKNLDKLTIEIADIDAQTVKFTCFDATDPTVIEDIPIEELTGPNQQNYEYTIQMTIGAYENEINTNVNFR